MPDSRAIPLEARRDGSALPLVAVGAVVVLVVAASVVADPLIGALALFGLIGALVISSRPAYAVTLLLGSFLVTYPWWLQGRGSLTLNNVLGAWLAVLMVYRIYRSGDWSFARNRELQLMTAIAFVFLLSRFLYRPDAHTMELVQGLSEDDQDPARVIVNRLAFLIFFVYFIRTPAQIRMVFLLAVGLMVLSGFAGVWRVLSGGGFAGYRANYGVFIWAAGNPNRLALMCTIGICALWYLGQWLRRWWVTIPVIGGIAVLMLAIFMTGSRSGVLALAGTIGLLFLDGGLSPRRIVAGVLTGLLATMLIVSVAPQKSLERITNLPGTEGTELGSGSIARRSYTASLALEVAEQNLLLGVGIGNWEINRYLSDPVHTVTPPHSSVLMALAEGGLVTLALYVLVLVRTLRNFLDTATVLTGPQHASSMQWIARTLRTSFMVFLAMSLVGDLWLNIIFYWYVGLGVVVARVVFEEVPAEEAHGAMLVEATA